jgi:N-acetylglucosaminyldiphosphoundecaprenol N-acetyl-beta-D-mannosaminyltransferase
MRGAPRRADVLGVEVTPITEDDLRQIIRSAIASKERCVIGHHNLHSVYLYHHDEPMRRFYASASWIYVDGMPLVWAGRARGHALRSEHRMTGIDILPPFLSEAERLGWRLFYLGSTAEALAQGVRVLKARCPRLTIEAADGYFDTHGEANDERIARINELRPDVLLVGMGMPRQERWVYDNANRLEATVIWTVGACLDYFAGVIPTPPRWLGRMGLEWSYRLAAEPHRLWRRYLVEPPYVMHLVARDLVRRWRG